MAALRMTPDSPAAQLAKAEDGLERAPAQEEEEEEEGTGHVAELEEEEEEIAVEEGEDKEMLEAEEEGGRAGHVDQVEVELEEDEEEVVAEAQSPALGTQERRSRGADAKSPVLPEQGKRQEPAPGGGGGQAGPGCSRSVKTQAPKQRSQELLTLLTVWAKGTVAARPVGKAGRPLRDLPLSLAGSSHT